MLGWDYSRQRGFSQAKKEFWWESEGAGTGEGDFCNAKGDPTTFISLLAARVGSSMSALPVWADSSVGRKPRLSIKLGGMGAQSTEQQLIKMFF